LVGAVNGGKGERGIGNGGPCCSLRSRVSSRPFPFPLSRFPFWLEILPHPLFPALTSEPRLPVPTEARRRVEHVGAVDPHHPCLDLGRHVEREVDVLGPH